MGPRRSRPSPNFVRLSRTRFSLRINRASLCHLRTRVPCASLNQWRDPSGQPIVLPLAPGRSAFACITWGRISTFDNQHNLPPQEGGLWCVRQRRGSVFIVPGSRKGRRFINWPARRSLGEGGLRDSIRSSRGFMKVAAGSAMVFGDRHVRRSLGGGGSSGSSRKGRGRSWKRF